MLYWKQRSRPVEQRLGSGPWRNVNQVDAYNGIRRLYRPRKPRYIKVKGSIRIRQVLLFNPQANGLPQIGISIGRLPSKARQRFGKMDDVLTRPAGDFQHNALPGQDA